MIREHLKNVGGEGIKIISKIENQEGLQNFDEILLESDAIMVCTPASTRTRTHTQKCLHTFTYMKTYIHTLMDSRVHLWMILSDFGCCSLI
jgi:hypothetical protein